MKVSLPVKDLLQCLNKVVSVVERRQTLPILGNVLLRAKNQSLLVLGTDLEVELSARIEIEDLSEEGEITVSARKFIDICRHLPEEARVDLHWKEEKLHLSCGRSKFSLSTLPANDFPLVEQNENFLELKVSAKVLHQLFQQTHFAMAQQDTRYFLNGAFLHLEHGKLTVVATNGHRLALASQALSTPIETQHIIPRKAVLELMKLLTELDSEISLYFGKHHLRLETGQAVMTSKLIEGRYPDYQKVIPYQSDKLILIDKQTLKQALNRVSVLSDDKFRGLRVELAPHQLTLNTNNPDHEQAEDRLDIDYEGETLNTAFNVNYLLDAINVLENGLLKLMLHNANTGVLIQHTEHNQGVIQMVMPMRL